MKRQIWIGFVFVVSLMFLVSVGLSVQAAEKDKKKPAKKSDSSSESEEAPPPKISPPPPKPIPSQKGSKAPPAESKSSPGGHSHQRDDAQTSSGLSKNVPGPSTHTDAPKPAGSLRVNVPGSSTHTDAPKPAGSLRVNVPGSTAPLRQKMNIPVSRDDNVKVLERHKEQRAKFIHKPKPVGLAQGAQTDMVKSVRVDSSTYYYRREVFYTHYNYVPPTYVYGMYPAYGIYDTPFLAFMLDNAAQQEYALMYYHHRNEEGMQEWRQEIDRLAMDNAELRGKLAQMDQHVTNLKGTAVDPTYIPSDVQDIAFASEVVDEWTKLMQI